MRIIEAYHCDYCKKYSKSKGAMTRHEKNCYHNPITKACASCDNYKQEKFRCEVVDELGVDSYYYRPVCDSGISLSHNNPNYSCGYRVELRNNCDSWKPKTEEL